MLHEETPFLEMDTQEDSFRHSAFHASDGLSLCTSVDCRFVNCADPAWAGLFSSEDHLPSFAIALCLFPRGVAPSAELFTLCQGSLTTFNR